MNPVWLVPPLLDTPELALRRPSVKGVPRDMRLVFIDRLNAVLGILQDSIQKTSGSKQLDWKQVRESPHSFRRQSFVYQLPDHNSLSRVKRARANEVGRADALTATCTR